MAARKKKSKLALPTATVPLLVVAATLLVITVVIAALLLVTRGDVGTVRRDTCSANDAGACARVCFNLGLEKTKGSICFHRQPGEGVSDAAQKRIRDDVSKTAAPGGGAGSGGSPNPPGQRPPSSTGGGGSGPAGSTGPAGPAGPAGNSQPAPQSPSAVNVGTPTVPILGQPKVCTPLLGVNC